VGGGKIGNVKRRVFQLLAGVATLLVLGGVLLNQVFPEARFYLRGVAGGRCAMLAIEKQCVVVHLVNGWPDGDGGLGASRHMWLVHGWSGEQRRTHVGPASVALDEDGVADQARLHWDQLVGWHGPMRTRSAGVRIETAALALSLLPGLWLGIAIVRWMRDRLTFRRRRAGLCVACGYDLRASMGRCPECGRVTGDAAVRVSHS
jgi:hypothetical protein